MEGFAKFPIFLVIFFTFSPIVRPAPVQSDAGTNPQTPVATLPTLLGKGIQFWKEKLCTFPPKVWLPAGSTKSDDVITQPNASADNYSYLQYCNITLSSDPTSTNEQTVMCLAIVAIANQICVINTTDQAANLERSLLQNSLVYFSQKKTDICANFEELTKLSGDQKTKFENFVKSYEVIEKLLSPYPCNRHCGKTADAWKACSFFYILAASKVGIKYSIDDASKTNDATDAASATGDVKKTADATSSLQSQDKTQLSTGEKGTSKIDDKTLTNEKPKPSSQEGTLETTITEKKNLTETVKTSQKITGDAAVDSGNVPPVTGEGKTQPKSLTGTDMKTSPGSTDPKLPLDTSTKQKDDSASSTALKSVDQTNQGTGTGGTVGAKPTGTTPEKLPGDDTGTLKTGGTSLTNDKDTPSSTEVKTSNVDATGKKNPPGSLADTDKSSETDLINKALDTSKQGVDIIKPGLDASKQGTDTGKQGLDASKQGTDTGKPGLDASKQGTDTSKLGLDASKQGTDTGKPGLDASKQGTDTSKLGLDASKQGIDTGKPGLDASKQGTDTSKQGLDASKQGTDTSKQGLDASKQGTDTTKQGLDATKQGTDTSKQGLDSTKQGTDTSKQGLDATKQGTDTSKQGLDASKQGTDTTKQGLDATKQGTDTSKQGLDSTKQGTDTSKQGLDATKQGTDTSKQGLDSTKQGTDTSKQGLDASKQGTDTSKQGLDANKQGPDKGTTLLKTGKSTGTKTQDTSGLKPKDSSATKLTEGLLTTTTVSSTTGSKVKNVVGQSGETGGKSKTLVATPKPIVSKMTTAKSSMTKPKAGGSFLDMGTSHFDDEDDSFYRGDYPQDIASQDDRQLGGGLGDGFLDTPEKSVPFYEEKGEKNDKKVQTGYKNKRTEEEAESSHFMAYFLTIVVVCIVGYVMFHNKQKIIAFILEGRSRGQRRRQNSGGAEYQKLSTNVDEVLPAADKKVTTQNYIY